MMVLVNNCSSGNLLENKIGRAVSLVAGTIVSLASSI